MVSQKQAIMFVRIAAAGEDAGQEWIDAAEVELEDPCADFAGRLGGLQDGHPAGWLEDAGEIAERPVEGAGAAGWCLAAGVGFCCLRWVGAGI
jgi:hypothetical protein